MDGRYDAVVYDLDGTLVDLAVDWAAVAAEVEALYDDAGNADAVRGADLWVMLDRASNHGLADEVEAAIAAHEDAGARESARLPTAAELAALEVPAGVCSLNCEAACRVALDTHGLARHVDSVVGRDSVATRKPSPEPLLATLEPLGVPPADALFVGDGERDEAAAVAAGVDFRYVGDGPDGR